MAEYGIHELFQPSRVIGEWFRLIEADINWFLFMSVVDAPFCNIQTQQFVPERLKWHHQMGSTLGAIAHLMELGT